MRFVIENTIEERILKLQEKKELVFEGYDFFRLANAFMFCRVRSNNSMF